LWFCRSESIERMILSMLARHPQWHFIRCVLGEAYARGGRCDDAIDQFTALIAADYDVATLYPAVAELHWRVGRYQEAADYLERAPAALAEDFKFRYTLGMSHLKAEAFESAIPHLAKAADLIERGRGALRSSQRGSIDEALGFCLFKAGRFRESAKWYEKALALSPGLAELRRNVSRALVCWVDALLERREFDEAAAQLEKALQLHPDADVHAQISQQLETVRELVHRQSTGKGN